MACAQMPIWDHLEELRERVVVGALAAAIAVLTCFCFSKELVVFLEAPVASQGVRFLQLSPGEFFFTTLKVRPPRGRGGTLHARRITLLPQLHLLCSADGSHPGFPVRVEGRCMLCTLLDADIHRSHHAPISAYGAQVAGYAGLLLATPTVLYEVVSYVVPGLTKSEKDLLAPIVFGSSILFYVG